VVITPFDPNHSYCSAYNASNSRHSRYWRALYCKSWLRLHYLIRKLVLNIWHHSIGWWQALESTVSWRMVVTYSMNCYKLSLYAHGSKSYF